jgi:hypothetical protein
VMSYCDAVRSKPHRQRVALARPNANLHWRATKLGARGGKRPTPLGINAMQLWGKPPSPAGYKIDFTSRCFRCLANDHKLATCRDPLCCLICRRSGHLARDCPVKRERNSVHNRLCFPKPSIQSRLHFPKPQPPSIQSRVVSCLLTKPLRN